MKEYVCGNPVRVPLMLKANWSVGALFRVRWMCKATLSVGILIRTVKAKLLYASAKARMQQSMHCASIPFCSPNNTEVTIWHKASFV